MRATKFVEGSFIPSFDGASERFHQGSTNLARQGVDLLVVHSFRGWSNLDQIAQKGFRTLAVPSQQYYRDTSITSQAVQIFQPDILEVNDLELGLSAGLELSNLHNIPLVFDAQFVSSCLAAAYTGDEATLEAIAKLERHLGRCISGATCFTDQDKEDFVKATRIPRERVRVIPMGSDIENINYRRINPDDKTIVFMGNMFFLPNQEGVEYVIEHLVPRLLENHPELNFRFVGDAPAELREKFQANNIQFTGRVENINDAFEGARICVSPITTGGGMRTKTLVYMASGIPIVSSPAGAIGIDSKDTMLLAHSPDEFITQIQKLLRDYDASVQQGQRARHSVETKYSWSVFAQQYVKFYEDIIRSKRTHHEKPISIENDPFWLQETIEKGRFSDNNGDPSNIYLLGRGEKTAIPIDSPHMATELSRFLKHR